MYTFVKLPLRDFKPQHLPSHTPQILILMEWPSRQGCVVILSLHLIFQFLVYIFTNELSTIITLWWFFLCTEIIRYHGCLYITIYIQFKYKYITFEGFWRCDRIYYHVFIVKYFVYLFVCCTIFIYFGPFFLFFSFFFFCNFFIIFFVQNCILTLHIHFERF